MGEYRDRKWCPTFGDVQAGVSDWAPGEVRFDTERALRKQLRQQAAEIKRLKERLECWPVDKAGNFDKSRGELPEGADGIACRDETIRALEAEIERLRSALERYELGIRWALGESPEGTPEFPAVTGPPYYRWRTTLRELTGIMPKSQRGTTR